MSRSTPLTLDVELPDAEEARRGAASAQITRRSASSALLAQRDDSRVGARRAGAAASTAQLGDDAAGPRGEDDDAVGEHERLLDVVGDEQDRARLARQRAGEPRLHLGAGDRVERAERLVEAQHGLAGQQRAQRTRRAGACRR